jgi:hypothetical protein
MWTERKLNENRQRIHNYTDSRDKYSKVNNKIRDFKLGDYDDARQSGSYKRSFAFTLGL